jgi:vacuolar-type H+-ATPase subunit I/STV1
MKINNGQNNSGFSVTEKPGTFFKGKVEIQKNGGKKLEFHYYSKITAILLTAIGYKCADFKVGNITYHLSVKDIKQKLSPQPEIKNNQDCTSVFNKIFSALEEEKLKKSAEKSILNSLDRRIVHFDEKIKNADSAENLEELSAETSRLAEELNSTKGLSEDKKTSYKDLLKKWNIKINIEQWNHRAAAYLESASPIEEDKIALINEHKSLTDRLTRIKNFDHAFILKMTELHQGILKGKETFVAQPPEPPKAPTNGERLRNFLGIKQNK